MYSGAMKRSPQLLESPANVFLLAVLLTTLVPSSASAQTYNARPLTTPGGHLDLHLGPAPKPLIEDAGLLFHTSSGDLDLRLGGSFGATDNIEIGASLLQLRLIENLDIGNPYLWGTFRIVSGQTEVGVRPVIPIPIFDSGFWLRVDIPVIVRLGMTRIETGGSLELGFHDPASAILTIPLRFVFNITSSLFLGLDTGVRAPLNPSGPASFPFGLFMGVTLPGDIDLVVAIRWPNFLVPERDPAFEADSPEIGLGINVFGLL